MTDLAKYFNRICLYCGHVYMEHLNEMSDRVACDKFIKDNLELAEKLAKERGLI